MTPRLRKKIHDVNANAELQESATSHIEEFTAMWLISCGNPLNRSYYLTGAYHWLQFLVDDLQLDYLGRPYQIHPWLSKDMTNRARLDLTQGVNIPEELMLDRVYVETKLRERLGNEGGAQRDKRPAFSLKTNLEKDKELVKFMFRLTEDISQPPFFSKILTADIRRGIENGMAKATQAGWSQRVRSSFGWSRNATIV